MSQFPEGKKGNPIELDKEVSVGGLGERRVHTKPSHSPPGVSAPSHRAFATNNMPTATESQ